jgi:hypothetical protein
MILNSFITSFELCPKITPFLSDIIFDLFKWMYNPTSVVEREFIYCPTVMLCCMKNFKVTLSGGRKREDSLRQPMGGDCRKGAELQIKLSFIRYGKRDANDKSFIYKDSLKNKKGILSTGRAFCPWEKL